MTSADLRLCRLTPRGGARLRRRLLLLSLGCGGQVVLAAAELVFGAVMPRSLPWMGVPVLIAGALQATGAGLLAILTLRVRGAVAGDSVRVQVVADARGSAKACSRSMRGAAALLVPLGFLSAVWAHRGMAAPGGLAFGVLCVLPGTVASGDELPRHPPLRTPERHDYPSPSTLLSSSCGRLDEKRLHPRTHR